MSHIRDAVTSVAKREMLTAIDKICQTYSLTQAEANACLAELQLSLLMAQLYEERREGST